MIERIESSAGVALRAAMSAVDAAAADVAGDGVGDWTTSTRTATGTRGTKAPATDTPSVSQTEQAAALAVRDLSPKTDLLGTPMEEYPPSFVFAPGFLHADRRGLVPYPGLQLVGDGVVAMVLGRRWVKGASELVDVASSLYGDMASLGADERDDSAN